MEKPIKTHFNDKILHCQLCDKDILIKHNQCGGYWHLSGWNNKHGLIFWGGVCSPCFDVLHEETNPENCGNLTVRRGTKNEN